jgi:predicted acetyltransferase
MNIELVKVEENERNILKNMLEFYSYDMSRFFNYELTEEGKFDRFDIDEYFNNDKNDVFFIKEEGKKVGFILTKKKDLFISFEEFWILPKYREGFFAYNVLKKYCSMINDKVQFYILNEKKKWLQCVDIMLKRNSDICRIIDKREQNFYLGHGKYKFTIFFVDCTKENNMIKQ